MECPINKIRLMCLYDLYGFMFPYKEAVWKSIKEERTKCPDWCNKNKSVDEQRG